jgi:hypothetical protein
MVLHMLETSGYAWLEGSPGSLLLRSDAGDTLVPDHDGRWTILEEAANLEEAQVVAREWASLAGHGPHYGFSNGQLDALVRVVELCHQVETAMRAARALLKDVPATGRAYDRPWTLDLPCSPWEARNSAGIFKETHDDELRARAAEAATKDLVD